MRVIRAHYSVKQKSVQFVICALVYFAVTMPFRKFFALSAVTEIRPAAALPPFFGMMYGFPGALGCAAANLAADLLSGLNPSMSFASFPVQFLMGVLPYLMWYRFPIRGEETIEFPRMDTTAHVVKYMLIILTDAIAVAFLLGCILRAFGMGEIVSDTTIAMFWNNWDFSYVLGLPMFSVVEWKRHRRFSLNGQIILSFLLFSILAVLLVVVLVYKEMAQMFSQRIVLWNHIYADAAVTLNVFIVAEVVFLARTEREVTMPVQKLASAAGEYVRKDENLLDQGKFIALCRPYASSENEVGNLAKSYIHMAQNLEDYMTNLVKVAAERERIGTELNLAAQIQTDMLPNVFPAFPERKEFDLHASMSPAKEVGGDFYDFFFVDEMHLGLVMADVSGKGVPAALFMANAKTLINTYARTGAAPSEILSYVNEQLCEGNKAELFVTVWLAIIDLTTGKGVAANAGHEHPALKRHGEQYQLVKYRHSPAVAAMEGMRFRQHEFELHSGDSLFVYTDGVTEASNEKDELFGEKRLVQALNASAEDEPEQVLARVKEHISYFTGSASQFDDITMLGFTYYGYEHIRHEIELEATDENLEQVQAFVNERLETSGCSTSHQMQIDVAVEEIFVNIAHYSYGAGGGMVRVRCVIEDGVAEITFTDKGIPYNPLEKESPDITLSAEEREIGGLGIFLVRKMMDSMTYCHKDDENILTITKTLA